MEKLSQEQAEKIDQEILKIIPFGNFRRSDNVISVQDIDKLRENLKRLS